MYLGSSGAAGCAVSVVHSSDSERNIRLFIRDFLGRKWARELNYRLMKELWCFHGNRISVRFEYEYFDADMRVWMRAHGNEHWEFDDAGLMRRRDMSANDYAIAEGDRRYRS